MDITKLRVYQQALEAFRLVEEIALKLPRDLGDVRKQVLRSARAVAPILAEGYGRKRSQKEFNRFVIESMSTADETITHLRTIAMSRFNRIPMEELKNVAERYKGISRQLNKLSSIVKKNF